MSIAEQITRIKNNVASAYVKAEEKGATMPTELNTDNLPATIESISGGGSDEIINQNPNGISPMYAWQGTEEEWLAGESKTWYNWKSGEGGLGEWTQSANLPITQRWTTPAYGNGKFIAAAWGTDSPYTTNTYIYSNDGVSWTKGTLPAKTIWDDAGYANGRFIMHMDSNSSYYYSEDGINWTLGNMGGNQQWNKPVYGNGVIVNTSKSGTPYYSIDGINWTFESFPYVEGAYWNAATYGNGKFVITSYGHSSPYTSSAFAYSEDGITWTQGTMPSSRSWKAPAYGDGKFVTVSGYYGVPSNIFAYSTDGINWTQGTMPSSQEWNGTAYGDGKFVATVWNSNVFAYSENGITWTQGTMPSSRSWQTPAYGDGKFVTVANNSNISAYLPASSSLQCFTDTETPTTSSTVYSAPSVESELTIEEVGEGDIVLSDMNVYDRNESGDQTTTQSIGEAHPDYLSFIDGVGVKIGTTDIADM